jgi:cytochrome c oxidase subunit 1
MPRVFSAFGNIFVPLLNAAPEVGYARLNNASLVIYTGTLLVIALVYASEFRIGLGWTFYPPLSTSAVLVCSYGVFLLVLALNIRGISSTLTSVNFLATALVRAVSFNIVSLGAYLHSLNTTSLLLVLVLPAFGVALVLLLCDATMNTGFYDASFGGDILLYRHRFWFFGHPEVYVLILPSFGIVSLTYSIITGSGVIGERVRVLGVRSIAALGLVVWAHHRFTTGRELDTRVYFSALTRVIAIPTGCKIDNYLLTRSNSVNSRLHANINLFLLVYVFVLLFTFGGATGVILGNAAVDIVLHDTYYVVAHFHYVLSLGSSIAIVIGTILVRDACTGINGSHNSTVSLHVVIVSLGSLLITFFARHRLGFNTRPRRYVEYSDALSVWNCICTFGTVHLLLVVPRLYLVSNIAVVEVGVATVVIGGVCCYGTYFALWAFVRGVTVVYLNPASRVLFVPV